MSEPVTLTPSSLEQLRALTGKERKFGMYGMIDRKATPAAIGKFALAVGDDNPIWWTDGPDRFAPPTFLYTGVNFNSWPDFNGLPPVQGQPITTLWAGDSWKWSSRLKRGEEFDARSIIENVREIGPEDRRRVLVREHITYTGSDQRHLADHYRTTIMMARPPVTQGKTVTRQPYDPEYLARIGQCYNDEIGRRRGPNTRTAAEAQPGTMLGPMVKGPLTIGAIISFAIAWGSPFLPAQRMQWRWIEDHPGMGILRSDTGHYDTNEHFHWDPQVWEATGFNNGYDFGPTRISWMVHLLNDWAGDEAMIDNMDVQLVLPNALGDVTWITGKVTSATQDPDGRWRIHCELEARNQLDQVNTRASADVLLPG